MFLKYSASAFLTALLLISGCGPSQEPSSNDSPANTGPAASATPSDELGGIEKTPAPAEKVEAVTLGPVVEAFCDAMRKKDEAGLRRVYSKATLRSFEADMRADGISTLVEFLSNEPVGDKCAVVNERIQGDVGEALVSTKTYPNGIMLKFVKEDNEWKMTNQSSDFDAVRKAARN